MRQVASKDNPTQPIVAQRARIPDQVLGRAVPTFGTGVPFSHAMQPPGWPGFVNPQGTAHGYPNPGQQRPLVTPAAPKRQPGKGSFPPPNTTLQQNTTVGNLAPQNYGSASTPNSPKSRPIVDIRTQLEGLAGVNQPRRGGY